MNRIKSTTGERQEYELIKPDAAFHPLGPVSHIEVHPVREYEGYCEPCTLGEESFWSVYVRYAPRSNGQPFGGADCIADCADFEGARNLAQLIAALLGIEVEGV